MFSLFDGETCHALDTAHTMQALQMMLEADTNLPVRGLGPAAFAECLLALRAEDVSAKHTGGQLDEASDDEGGDERYTYAGDDGSFHGGGGQGATTPTAAANVNAANAACAATQPLCSAAMPGAMPPSGLAGSYQPPYVPEMVDADRLSYREEEEGAGTPSGGHSSGHGGGLGGSGGLGGLGGGSHRVEMTLDDEAGTRVTIGESYSRTGLAPSQMTPAQRTGRLLRRTFRSGRFARAMDVLVLLSGAVLIAEVELLLRSDWRGMRALEHTAPFFDAAFLCESALKAYAFGPAKFRRRRADVYAALVAAVVAVADVAYGAGYAGRGGADASADASADAFASAAHASAAHAPGSAEVDALRVAFGLRLLRLPRLVLSLNQTSTIFRQIYRSLPSFLGLFGFVFVVFSVFAQIGVACFGGKIRKPHLDAGLIESGGGLMGSGGGGGGGGLADSGGGDSGGGGHADAPELMPRGELGPLGTSNGTHGPGQWPGPPGTELYVYCNFNDLPSALVTLFELTVVNNWAVIMEVTVGATRSQWSRVYFITWFWVGAVGMFNLLVAQILESVMEHGRRQHGKHGQHGGGGGGESGGGMGYGGGAAAGFGQRGEELGRHYGTLTAEMAALVRRGPATAAQRRRSMQAAGSHADAGGGRGGGGGGGSGDHDVTDTGAVGAAAEGNPSGGAEEAAACDVLADGSGTDSALTSLDGDTLALSAAELPVGLVERMSALRSDPSRDFRTAASVQDAGPVNRCSPMEQM